MPSFEISPTRVFYQVYSTQQTSQPNIKYFPPVASNKQFKVINYFRPRSLFTVACLCPLPPWERRVEGPVGVGVITQILVPLTTTCLLFPFLYYYSVFLYLANYALEVYGTYSFRKTKPEVRCGSCIIQSTLAAGWYGGTLWSLWVSK